MEAKDSPATACAVSKLYPLAPLRRFLYATSAGLKGAPRLRVMGSTV